MQKIPLTVRGAELLKQELQHLKSVERPAIIEAIAEARTHGDLSENAEYEAAKEKQGFIEGRISELENKPSAAHIIDPTEIHAEGKIVFGIFRQIAVGSCFGDSFDNGGAFNAFKMLQFLLEQFGAAYG